MNYYPSNNNNNGGAGYETEGQTSRQGLSLTLPPQASYDVYLSFRGNDTRSSFTDHLYRGLVDAGISVFRDDDYLRVGESIGPELCRAIVGSKISIPIISPDYASSKWCLDELVQILKCMKTSGQRVLPIFYRVEALDVRHQKGSFRESFSRHNQRYGSDSKLVQEWKNALAQVSSMNGLESNKVADGHEGELVKIVVTGVVNELREAIPNLRVGASYEIEDQTSEQIPPPTLPSGKSYQVFLSFRGETRRGFTDHLYRRLVDAGISVFRDDEELRVGESIGPELCRAIVGSKISIPIISPNYAASKWCLDELVQILMCMKTLGQRVLPIFFKVKPSDVRHQNGSFGEAFGRHNKRYGSDSKLVEEWKNALTEVSSLKGWESDIVANGHEGELVGVIVRFVLEELRKKQLHVADFPVMLEHHVNQIASELVKQPMVGLWGMGGIGKTTIAKAVYNVKADSFDGVCFLANVRENSRLGGVVRLQENLLCDVLDGANFRINYVDDGIKIIRDRLGEKKILVVLDDVDHLDQLRKLVGDFRWFGPGSRVIITTRDEHLLIAHGVNFIYEVPGLDDSHAHKLFVWNAFRETSPSEELKSPIHWVVDYAKGLPLALIVLGSFLCGRSLLEWQSAMNRLEKIPDKDINEVLKISYDGLGEEEQKIFLDLACFFKGRDVVYVMKVLSACDFNARIGLKILTERSLVGMHSEKLEMHDLIQLMGREIVRQESTRDPGKRSRLWSSEDIIDVLSNDSGTEIVEAMVADMPESEEPFLSAVTFNKMRRLRLLGLRNAQYSGDPVCFFNELRFLEWPRMSLSVLEFNRGPKKLVDINMSDSKFTQLGKGFKNFKCLTSIDFRNCEGLVYIPDFSTIPNLELLLLSGCESLVEVHESIGYLSRLVTLDLHSCSNLRAFPSVLHLINLHNFILTGCSCLTTFPHIAKNMQWLRELHAEKTGIKELPSSIERLESLQAIYLDGCENLSSLPVNIYKLQHVCNLSLNGCSKLEKFPELEETSCCSKTSASPSIIKLILKNCNLLEVDKLLIPHWFSLLIHIDLSGNPFLSLPLGMERLSNLEWLGLENCEQLLEIPDLPLSIKEVHARCCKSLEYVNLSGLYQKFPVLKHMDFSNCHRMIWSADDPSSKGLKGRNCVSIYRPGSEIPRWFDHQNNGSSLRFPVLVSEFLECEAIALCAIFGLNESSDEVDVDIMSSTIYTILINVDELCFLSEKGLLHPIGSDHMVLFCDAQCLLEKRWMVRKHPNESVNFEVSIQINNASREVVLRKVGVRLADKRHYDLEFSPKTSTVKAESSKKTPKLRQDHNHAHADCLPVSA